MDLSQYLDKDCPDYQLPFAIERPLVFLDIEATGADPQNDRIIEIHLYRFSPNEEKLAYRFFINPTIPIPEESSLIHGYRDDDVIGCPSFSDIGHALFDLLKGADIGGYNVIRFDIRILFSEFKKLSLEFDLSDIRIADPFQIFVKKNRRDLGSAYQYFCGKELVGAHGARADNLATIEVFIKQMEKYDDLPLSLGGVSEFCTEMTHPYIDPEKFLVWKDEVACLNFGKHKGKSLKLVAKEDYNFLHWISKNNFNPILIKIVKLAMKGQFPEYQARPE